MNGRRFRLLTIVDLWDRNCPCIELDHSLPGERVVRVLEALRLGGRKPFVLRMDNGPELTGKALDRWAHEHGVQLDFIRPGRPTDNGHIESFNGRLREECLNQNVFVSLADARRTVEVWRQDYNRHRPHSALAGLSPEQFRASYPGNIKEQAVTNLSLGYQAG